MARKFYISRQIMFNMGLKLPSLLRHVQKCTIRGIKSNWRWQLPFSKYNKKIEHTTQNYENSN